MPEAGPAGRPTGPREHPVPADRGPSPLGALAQERSCLLVGGIEGLDGGLGDGGSRRRPGSAASSLRRVGTALFE